MGLAGVVFDLYGTLLRIDDLTAAVARAGVPEERCQAFVDAWRSKQLLNAFLCSLMQRYRDFDDLTSAALDYVVEAHGLTLDSTQRGALLAAWGSLAAHDDAARAYKPDPRVYALAQAHFATEPSEIAFVSSNGWDAAGAASFGFRTIWCNRTNAPAERIGSRPDAVVAGLRSLGEVLGQR